jgi:hypothetical protein
MKHLTDEERLAFLEGNATPEIASHVAQCPACAEEVQAWRRSIQRLEKLEWPARIPRHVSSPAPILKWALAAGIVLCAGFGLGRFTGPSLDEIKAAVKADVTHDLRQQLATVLRDQRKSEIDPNMILSLFGELREQQNANYVSLRKDLETLASTADARLQSNSRQIRELVASTFSDPIQ